MLTQKQAPGERPLSGGFCAYLPLVTVKRLADKIANYIRSKS